MSKLTIHGRTIVGGITEGEALVSTETLSGFGGLDRETGIVIDKRHQLYNQCLKNKILIIPGAKGSSSFSIYFHYLRLNDVAPKAILYNVTTSKMALGALVCHVPAMTDFDLDPVTSIRTGDWVHVDADNGVVQVLKQNFDILCIS
jgi:predicted aconitase with swiveling domain